MSNAEVSKNAWSLLFEDAMPLTDSLFSQGNLKGFKGCTRTLHRLNRSIHVTTGRFSKTALKAISVQE